MIIKNHRLFDLLRFSHFDCWSPPVKTYANKRTLFEKIVAYSGLEPAISCSSLQFSTN